MIFKYYLIIINIISFIICFIDKYRACKKKYRVSEKVLVSLCFFGGCFGFFLGMILFHHKTRKIKFIILVPILIILWFIIYILYINT